MEPDVLSLHWCFDHGGSAIAWLIGLLHAVLLFQKVVRNRRELRRRRGPKFPLIRGGA